MSIKPNQSGTKDKVLSGWKKEQTLSSNGRYLPAQLGSYQTDLGSWNRDFIGGTVLNSIKTVHLQYWNIVSDMSQWSLHTKVSMPIDFFY